MLKNKGAIMLPVEMSLVCGETYFSFTRKDTLQITP